jgi:TonB family protein
MGYSAPRPPVPTPASSELARAAARANAQRADLVALTADENLLAVLREATLPGRVWQAHDSGQVADLLVAMPASALLIDAATCGDQATVYAARLGEQFPEITVLVSGSRQDESSVSRLISNGVVYRFLHLPASVERARTFLQGAQKRASERREAAPAQGGKSPAKAAAKAPARQAHAASSDLSPRDGFPWRVAAPVLLLAGIAAVVVQFWPGGKAEAPVAAVPAAVAPPLVAEFPDAPLEQPPTGLPPAEPIADGSAPVAATPPAPAPAPGPAPKPAATQAPAPAAAALPAPAPAPATKPAATAAPPVVQAAAAPVPAASAPPLTQVDRDTADMMWTQALGALAAGRLAPPAEQPASEWALRLRRLEPDSARTRDLLARLDESLLAESRRLLADQRHDAALTLLGTADALAPDAYFAGRVQNLRAEALEAKTRARERAEAVPERLFERKKAVPPTYPKAAQAAKVAGWVELAYTINVRGEPENFEVLGSDPKGTFERAAIDAVQQWRYVPKYFDGAPVAQRVKLRLRFVP